MDASSTASTIREARITAIVSSLLDYVWDSTLSPNMRRRLIQFLLLQRMLPGLRYGLFNLGMAVLGALIGPIVFIPDALTSCTFWTLLLPPVTAPMIRYVILKATNDECTRDITEAVLNIGLYSSTAFALRYCSFSLRYFISMLSRQMVLSAALFLILVVILRRVLSASRLKTRLDFIIKRGQDLTTYLSTEVISSVIEAVAASSRTFMKGYNQWETEVFKINRRAREGTTIGYEYRALSHSREIRILRLQRRRLLTQLQCELIHVSLDNGHIFEAISYTWRNETPTEKILVNGCDMSVTPTIYEMLHYRHSFLGYRYFWIDGICINQHDVEERSQQVQIMRDIYRFASRVVVWLGPPNEALDAHLVPPTLCFLEHNQASSKDKILDGLLNERLAGWRAILRLLDHSWFERIWVVQEVAVAKIAHVIYGDICIGWGHLSNSLEAVLSRKDLQDLILISGATRGDFDRITEHFLNANVMTHFQKTVRLDCLMSLGDVLIRTLSFRSGDPRDKIFAIFGISAGDNSYGLVPDYRKSVAEVYLAATRHLMSAGNVWHISYALQLAGVGFPPSAIIHRGNSPSWVADFTEKLVGRIIWNSKGKDLYGSDQTGWDADNLFSIEPEILLLETIEIDRVEYLSESYWFDDGSGSLLDSIEQAQQWLIDAKSVLAYVMDRREVTISKANAIERAFYATLLGNETIDESIEWNAYKNKFEQLLKAMKNTTEFEDTDTEQGSNFRHIMNRCIGRRLCATAEGRFAVVPPLSRQNDIICIVRSLWPPFILRQKPSQNTTNSLPVFELVGSCYIQGMMEKQTQNLPWKSYRVQ